VIIRSLAPTGVSPLQNSFKLSPGFRPSLLLLLWLALIAPVAAAYQPADDSDKPYALLFVTVWGPDAHPVYRVKVKIRRATEKKARWELYSDHHGELAQRLPPGPADYVAWADPKGVKDQNGKDCQPGDPVSVHFVKDERLDIGLHLK
jgi:hypothetical protein